jgi:Spy/CpxP family protein refolding chaperone
MKKPLFAFLVLMSFASALLLAQNSSNPPGPPTPAMRVQHRVQFLTTMLSLNSAQQQQATTIFTNAATAEQAVHNSMKTAHQDLNNAVKANDAAAIDQAAQAIASVMAQTISTQAKANAAFRQLLNADQQAKLDQLDSQGPHVFAVGGGGNFFFGMGGPPPR